ncbi:MAG: Lysophospholipid acyltransferase [uncultured Blastococcus sp.]|uniref:Lysophospholipid acyltransferase n=1 Tax=uncultured Blastococcus sp. TaxID=217144 RepID=A0A6J4IEF0_9ACTN|nr:MAG: Lysophospholipid acyltransferase [uncultured Blastococcus sp.]
MRYPALNGLRALAATAVVATHAAFWSGSYTPDALGYALARLDVGVAVFFALSGFLLSLPLFRAAAAGRPAPRTGAFLWRRALRILPAYWVCVAVAMLFLPGNRELGAGDWLRFLTLTQIYSRNWHAEGLDHAWSLCTEVAFYVLLPLVVAGLLRLSGGRWRPGLILVVLGLASVLGFGWFAWAASDPFLLGSLTLWLPAYFSWFAAGMVIAVLSVASPDWAPVRRAHELGDSPWTCWGGAAALFWAASGPFTGAVDVASPLTAGQGITKHLLYTGIAALAVWPLVFGDQTAGWGRRFLASRPMDWLGERSYGLFLFHMPLLLIMWDLFSHPLGIVFTGTWLVGVLVAALVHRVVERPLMQRWRDLVPDRPSAHAGAVATGADDHPAGIPAGIASPTGEAVGG